MIRSSPVGNLQIVLLTSNFPEDLYWIQQFQIKNILPILDRRSIVSGGVGQVRSLINGALRVFLA